MKRFSVIALAVAAVMLFAIPAMAVDVDFSGHYRVRGFFEDNTDLDDSTGASDARMDMRFRIQPVFKIHDNLKLTVRFDGVDNQEWESTHATSEDIGLERVYLDASFDMFALRIGRMAAGACGLKYCDAEGDADRIKVILKGIDPWYLDYTYQKSVEQDYNSGATASTSDEDFDAHWIHGFYSAETMTTGMLFGYYNNKTGVTDTQQYWLFDPYFKGTFGPLSVEAELQWKTGDYVDYDGATPDRDYDAWRYILDVAFDFGQGSVGAGYAHSDGQKVNTAGNEDYTNAGLGGNDWEPFLIMTHWRANAGLGGTALGNLNSINASTAMTEFGFDIFYLYGSFAAMEDLTLNAIVGFATADETNTPSYPSSSVNVDDEIGWEFDVGAKYKIMDNLTYDIKLGFFQTGDLYKLGDTSSTKDDDTWAIMHTLIVTF